MKVLFLIEELRKQLFTWWDCFGRHDLPWKYYSVDFITSNSKEALDGELDPYPIWIAEIMLQQTQVRVMLSYWERWMKAFPNKKVLAEARLDQVLLAWQGLGYYTRAHRLHAAAFKLKDSPWPRTLEGWMALPGIGRTTAGSILSSAFNYPFPILDGNVRRLLARLTAFDEPQVNMENYFWSLSNDLLDKERPRDFNQALMDFGALVCTPFNPTCQSCPFQKVCSAYSLGNVRRFPLKNKSKLFPVKVIGIAVILNQVGDVLIDQRLDKGLLAGMWEFPGGKQEEGELIEKTIEREVFEELAIHVEVKERLIELEHKYGQKQFRFIVHLCKWLSGDPKPLASQQVRWVSPNSLHEYPFPAANSKIIQALVEYLSLEIDHNPP